MTSKTTLSTPRWPRLVAVPATLLLFVAATVAAPIAAPAGQAASEGPAPSLERAQSLPGGEAYGGLFHLTLTASVAGSVAQGGDFELRPGLDPGSETSPLIFADGFESGAADAWSDVTP